MNVVSVVLGSAFEPEKRIHVVIDEKTLHGSSECCIEAASHPENSRHAVNDEKT